jgi:hypothetical protein
MMLNPSHADDEGGYCLANGHNRHRPCSSLASLVIVSSTTIDVLLEGTVGG